MLITRLSLSGTLAASTLLTLTAATPSPNGSRGQIYLNMLRDCPTYFSESERPTPDTCLSIKGLNYRSIEIAKPWPVCDNGTDALFVEFDAGSGTCDPKLNAAGAMKRLLTKSEVLGRCRHVADTGSFSFWCDGVTPLPEPEAPDPRDGGLVRYPMEECTQRLTREVSYYPPDTCVAIARGKGLSFTKPAVCKNGTNAIVAGFKGKDCDPTSDPLRDPFSKWSDEVIGWCVPTIEISSMVFWCDGLEGLDMRKPYHGPPEKKGANMGLILGLSLGLGIPFLLVVGLFVAYTINYHFREKVKEMFGTGDGYIAL